MGKGCANFRVTQIQQGIKPLPDSAEIIQLDREYKSWELPAHHEQVLTSLKAWILKARIKFRLSPEELPMPVLSYKLKGNTIGQAFYISPNYPVGLIKINPVYLENHSRVILTDTIPHEVCHIVTAVLHGRAIYPHGREWQRVCFDLGHYPSVTCKEVGDWKTEKRNHQQQFNNLSAEDF